MIEMHVGATGRPGYHPAALLKLYVYGYLNRILSSRRLEREAGRNVEVMWLTARLFLNRTGFFGGSNFQIGWSHDEQNDEQILA